MMLHLQIAARRISRATRLAAVVSSLLLCSFAFADHHEGDREPDRAQEHLIEILDRLEYSMEALRELDRPEELQALERIADGVRARIRGLDERLRARKHLIESLEQLEYGMMALRELDRPEELQALERIADGVRERIRGLEERRERGAREREDDGRRSERAEAEDQIGIMMLAMHALREAGDRDAAERLQHAIYARKVAIEGRRDAEARRIREIAPDQREQVELLRHASRLWDELGQERPAQVVGEYADRMAGQLRARRERERHEEGSDRNDGRRWMEIMEMAAGVMERAGREDEAALVRRALEAWHGEGDERRGSGPDLGALADVMREAASLLEEWGAPDRAGALHELADGMEARLRGGRPEEGRDRDEHMEEIRHRIHELETHLAELTCAVHEAHEMLEEISREVH